MPNASAEFHTRGNAAASPPLTEGHFAAMREWVADQLDYPSVASRMTPDRVLDFVAQHYPGSVAGFIADQL